MIEFEYKIKIDLSKDEEELAKKAMNDEKIKKTMMEILEDMNCRMVNDVGNTYESELIVLFGGEKKTVKFDNYPF